MGFNDTAFGPIVTSKDSGSTWTVTSAPGAAWSSAASSADGTRLVAAIGADYLVLEGGVLVTDLTGPVYVSKDSGQTWTPTDAPTNHWASVASSADGCKLVAAVRRAVVVVNSADFRYTPGGIYTSQSTPTPFLNIIPSDGNLNLFWTVPSMNFVLQQNSDLAVTDWTDVTTRPDLNYSNLHYEVTLPAPTSTRFYRLVSR